MATTPQVQSYDDLTPHQLIAEIQEIRAQYQQEVSTTRRTWPASIRERALALHRLGVKTFQIAKVCGIPEATVGYWCSPAVRKAQEENRKRRTLGKSKEAVSGHFLPVAATQSTRLAAGGPTVGPIDSEIPQAAVTKGLALLLPGGIEVRGIASVAQVLELCRGLRS